MIDVEAARKTWRVERPEYERFGQMLRSRLKIALLRIGIYADVHARAKEQDSLFKKLLLKPHHTYDSLPDKVGVRVVVKYRANSPRSATGVESL